MTKRIARNRVASICLFASPLLAAALATGARSQDFPVEGPGFGFDAGGGFGS
jgi:hypothetical protein